jgi:hypothetical protein
MLQKRLIILIISLFLLPIKAYSEEVFNKPTWKALLHFKENEFFINGPKFLFSYPNQSLEKELKLSLIAFKNTDVMDDSHAICQFPARFNWLSEQLNLPKADFPKPTCNEYNEFLEKAPADNIELVFASENVSSPSSMMGHSFLKISGKNAQNNDTSHAISYFTVLDSFNPANLIFRSLVTGMDGIFALLPYKKHIEHYQTVENRNIWEYQIKLTHREKKLIHQHIWELKDKPSSYYFTKYNCATLTHFLLAIAEPRLLQQNHNWVTPQDVIKDAFQFNLIKSANLKPSLSWQIKMLVDNVSTEDQLAIKNNIRDISKVNTNSSSSFKTELMVNYNQYAFTENIITTDQYKDNTRWLNSNFNNDFKIDVSRYKAPQKTPNDSQFSIGLIRKDNVDLLSFQIMPAAHRLQDDNRQYFSENALELADLQLNIDVENQNIELDHFTLYGVKSLIPIDRFTYGLSGQWKVGIDQQVFDHLNFQRMAFLEGGLGYTLPVKKDIEIYTLLNLGGAVSTSLKHAYLVPEIGFIINEVWDMKSNLNFQAVYSTHNKNPILKTTFTQSLYLNQDRALFAEWQNFKQKNMQLNEIKLSFSYFF